MNGMTLTEREWLRVCQNCGEHFIPQTEHQWCCSEKCLENYLNRDKDDLYVFDFENDNLI